jgi:hypothetical protein
LRLGRQAREREEAHQQETTQLINKMQARLFSLENKLNAHNNNVGAQATLPPGASNDVASLVLTSLLNVIHQQQQPHLKQ